jgi:hypothetical protein
MLLLLLLLLVLLLLDVWSVLLCSYRRIVLRDSKL